MKDEQIIKASEVCGCNFPCDECPCDDFCDGHPIEAAVDLMKRQKAEIERLTAQLVTARADAMKEFAAELSAEICAALASNYRALDEHIENYNPVDPELYGTISGKIAALRGISEAMGEILQKMTGEG